MKHYMKEEEWTKIYSILQGVIGIHTHNEKRLRVFVEAVWYMARAGCQWRLLPEHYGHWRAVHKRFFKWARKGHWERLFQKIKIDPDMESVLIDATIVRAHACSAGYEKNSQDREALGRSVGGFTTKIHAVVDALGNPLKFGLTPGQCHDVTQASQMLKEFEGTQVLADKGYDSAELVTQLQSQRCAPIVPSRSNAKNPREYDKHVYKERHLVECFFSKIKHFRHVFSRFDKTAQAFLGFLNFVGVLIWLR
jgi:transposase